jgi:hypothetical protein
MKQIRVKSDESEIEEKDSFEPEWLNETNEIYSSSIIQSFIYTNDDNETSDSGGYIYEFIGRLSDIESNLSLLHQLEWIDNRTREVIIQFNLYNPNVELFISMTFIVEFLLSGGLSPQSLFQPFSFQG